MLQAMVMFATCQLHHGLSALQAARATSKLTWPPPPGSEKREVTLKTGKKVIWGNDGNTTVVDRSAFGQRGPILRGRVPSTPRRVAAVPPRA